MKTKSGTENVQDAKNAAVNEILLNTEAELFAAAGMQRETQEVLNRLKDMKAAQGENGDRPDGGGPAVNALAQTSSPATGGGGGRFA